MRVYSQQTYYTPGVPASSTSFTPTFRYIGTDSLVKIFIANGNRTSQVYTAAQANARFGVRGLATSTNYGAFYNSAGKLVLVPGFTTDSGTYFAFSKSLYYNAPKTYSTGNPHLVLEPGNKIGLDTIGTAALVTNGLKLISPDSIGLGGSLTQDVAIFNNGHSFDIINSDGTTTTGFNVSPSTIAQEITNSTDSYSFGANINPLVTGYGLYMAGQFTGGNSQFTITKSSMSVYDSYHNIGLIDSIHHTVTSGLQLAEIQDIHTLSDAKIDSVFSNPAPFTAGVIIDPAGAPQQPALTLNHGSYIDMYDDSNTTFTSFAQQSGEMWFENSGSTNLVALNNGQLYERDNMGIETPYITSSALPDTTLLAKKIGSADMVQHSYTGYRQTVYNPSGQAYTVYHNGTSANGVLGYVGMQQSKELNMSWNMQYDNPSSPNVHRAIDPTVASTWWGQGSGIVMLQYATANVPQTGVGNITITTAGTGLTNGSYNLLAVGGTGTLERIIFTVSGGSVTTAVAAHQGVGYTVNDVLTVSGFSGVTFTVNSIFTDIWNATGQHNFLKMDVASGSVAVGVQSSTFNFPTQGAQLEVPHSTVYSNASISGIGDGRGLIIEGVNDVTKPGEIVQINPATTGGVSLAGGGGKVVFGNISPVQPAAGISYFTPDTSVSGAAIGSRYRQSLVAAANNDILYGAVTDPVYTDGAFTGVVHISNEFRDAPVTFQTITTPTNFREGMFWHTGTVLAFYTNSTIYRAMLQSNATASSGQIPVADANGKAVYTTPTGTGTPVAATSPTLAGTPLAPTATAGTNTTQIATTAFVSAATGAHHKGSITLVAGVGTATVTGLTISSIATTGFISVGGTVSTTWQYKVACTANTLIITAITNAGTTDTTDTSTIGYQADN